MDENISTISIPARDVKALRGLLDGIVKRGRGTLDADVADARAIVKIADQYEATTRDLADALDRNQSEISITLRAGRLTVAQVKAYKDANKRVVSLSGLVTFSTTGGVTPTPLSAVDRVTSSINKLDDAAALDAIIKAAQARKRALLKAALAA